MNGIENFDIINTLQTELLVLIPACWGVGAILKSSKFIKNRYIPLCLSIFSVTMATLYTFATQDELQIALGIFTSVVQGLACWCVAWISYEKVIKPIIKKSKSNSECDSNKDDTQDSKTEE